MGILVDSSVWIDYFKGGDHCKELDLLIDENSMVTNEIILTELTPYLKIKKQTRLIQLLHTIRLIPLSIDWNDIINFQVKCLKRGANGIGIPDLMIAQNDCAVYSLDKHFSLLQQALKIKLYG